MTSLNLLAIKPKTWRDLLTDEQFTRSDIITIQDPNNLASRDLREYDYVKTGRKVTDDDMAGDPLKGINVDAAGGASKVLKMIAEKVCGDRDVLRIYADGQTRADQPPVTVKKEAVVVKVKKEQLACELPHILLQSSKLTIRQRHESYERSYSCISDIDRDGPRNE
jgi:peptidyl-prolyl cis-trans isomerase-like protein 2